MRLRRRSGSQPEPLVFFVDRSLGRGALVDALRGAGANVVVHDDEFDPDTADEEWLQVAGQKGWVVLTKDRNIKKRPLERAALIAAEVRAFVLTSGELTGLEMAEIFVRHLPEMTEISARKRPPFLVRVTKDSLHFLPISHRS